LSASSLLDPETMNDTKPAIEAIDVTRSFGGVHAVDKHLFALIDLAEREHVPHVAIHALLDGRDTLPRSALGFMEQTLERAKGRATVASVGGRYHGMDRDRRWGRTELWYRAMMQGVGPRASDPLTAIRAAYERGESDEFMKPVVIERNDQPVATVRDGDAIILFNFRADRMRQITRALTGIAQGIETCLYIGNLTALRDWGERINHLHVKDVHNEVLAGVIADAADMPEAWRRGVFCELGTGDVDLDGFFAELARSSYSGWLVVEQDMVPQSPQDAAAAAESQVRNRAWLREHASL